MSNQEIPRYIEGINPGFEELNLTALPHLDTAEQSKLRNDLIIQIQAEYDRLRLAPGNQEYLEHYQEVLGLDKAPLTQLKMYLDWLKNLVTKES